jgi:hypothetical protein
MVNFKRKSIKVRKDLRQKPRLEFHEPVTIMGLNETAQIIDFSVTGFFVQSGLVGQLKKGQQVRIAIRFPFEKGITVIKAKIVRTEENGFGCRFVDIDVPLLALLERSFDFLSTTLPAE